MATSADPRTSSRRDAEPPATITSHWVAPSVRVVVPSLQHASKHAPQSAVPSWCVKKTALASACTRLWVCLHHATASACASSAACLKGTCRNTGSPPANVTEQCACTGCIGARQARPAGRRSPVVAEAAWGAVQAGGAERRGCILARRAHLQGQHSTSQHSTTLSLLRTRSNTRLHHRPRIGMAHSPGFSPDVQIYSA